MRNAGRMRHTLCEVVSASIESPDIVVGKIGHHVAKLWIASKEVLSGIGTALRLEVLVFAVDSLFHAFFEHTLGVALKQRIPVGAPNDFDDVPARASECCLKLLNDLAITANWTV